MSTLPEQHADVCIVCKRNAVHMLDDIKRTITSVGASIIGTMRAKVRQQCDIADPIKGGLHNAHYKEALNESEMKQWTKFSKCVVTSLHAEKISAGLRKLAESLLKASSFAPSQCKTCTWLLPIAVHLVYLHLVENRIAHIYHFNATRSY